MVKRVKLQIERLSVTLPVENTVFELHIDSVVFEELEAATDTQIKIMIRDLVS